MPHDGNRTLYFILGFGGGTFDRLGFVDPDRCPEIEGEAAWVRVQWWSKSNYRVIEQVADRSGAPMPHGT
ncbi:MAG: hypothetical protein EON90_13290 [Brevundimonas sp.]|nr:MAG: hypothetical protein EON90_13290 [Brevundimonas sp.]